MDIFFIIGGFIGGYLICLAATYGSLRSANFEHTSFIYFLIVYGWATVIMFITSFGFSWPLVITILFTLLGGLVVGTINYFLIRSVVRIDPQPIPDLIDAAEGDPTEAPSPPSAPPQ